MSGACQWQFVRNLAPECHGAASGDPNPRVRSANYLILGSFLSFGLAEPCASSLGAFTLGTLTHFCPSVQYPWTDPLNKLSPCVKLLIVECRRQCATYSVSATCFWRSLSRAAPDLPLQIINRLRHPQSVSSCLPQPRAYARATHSSSATPCPGRQTLPSLGPSAARPHSVPSARAATMQRRAVFQIQISLRCAQRVLRTLPPVVQAA
jgi:hypothetical protein